VSALQVTLVVLGTLWVASHLIVATHTAMSRRATGFSPAGRTKGSP
jgi:hypothetical protein